MAQSFLERYAQEDTWVGRATVMEIFHLTATSHDKTWTVTKTAQFFNVSIGLASENLKIAAALHDNEKLMDCATRQEALNKIK